MIPSQVFSWRFYIYFFRIVVFKTLVTAATAIVNK